MKLANFYQFVRKKFPIFFSKSRISVNRIENEFLVLISLYNVKYLRTQRFYKRIIDTIDNHWLTAAVTRTRIIKLRGDNN